MAPPLVVLRSDKMADTIRARDLMRKDFLRIGFDQTLGEAMAALRETRGNSGLPSALMVVDDAGQYRGMLTARLLIRLLVGGDDGQCAKEDVDDLSLLRAARDRLLTRVGDSLVAGIPVVGPEDRLLTMIRRGASMRLDFLPVVSDGVPVGFAPVTAIFQAAAGMALTPADEGIRFDR
jgi:CBS domain-containing protein